MVQQLLNSMMIRCQSYLRNLLGFRLAVIFAIILVMTLGLDFSIDGTGWPSSVFPLPEYDAPPLRELTDGPPNEEDGERGDTDTLRERTIARLQLFENAPDQVKQHAIDVLVRQQQLYPNQVAGAPPAPGIRRWQSIGPTEAKYEATGSTPNVTLDISDTGRIRNILPHPTDPDIVYVLTSGGGLWKTTTFTHANPQWEPKTDGLISTSGGSVAFGRDPNTLYLGIGDPYDVRGLIAGVVVKSTDGGNTWSPFVNLYGASAVRDLKVDTSGPNDVILVGTDIGMFRSADNGASFQQVGANPGQAFYYLRSVWSMVRTSAGWLASAQDDHFDFVGFGQGYIFYSTDKGATWTPIPNVGSGFSDVGRTTLSVATPGEAVVYGLAGTIDGSAQKDVFKSTDGGLNWTALNVTAKTPTNPAPIYQPNMNILGVQPWYNQLILTDPLDPARNTVYIGGQLSTAKTGDSGNSWTLMSSWLPTVDSNLPYIHADCHAAAFSTLGGENTLFFGGDGGIFISTDRGNTWSDDKNDGLNSQLAYAISNSGKTKQTPIIGLQDTGVRVRLGSSTKYNQVRLGDGTGVGWSQANNAFTLSATQYSNIRRAENLLPNTFGTWTLARSGIGGSDYYPFYTNILTPTAAADPTGGIFYTHTGWRIYATINGGASWFRIGEAGFRGLRPKQAGGNFKDFLNTMGVSPVDPDHVAIAENSGWLAITADGGFSWTERNIKSLVPGHKGSNSSPAWANNTTLYLGSNWPFVGSIPVVKSTDGGVTWTAKSNGLPDIPVSKLLVDPRDPSGTIVYAATWIGVYRTTNGGNSWHLFGAGLPAVEVSDMYMPEDGSFLRISTYGRGVWEINP